MRTGWLLAALGAEYGDYRNLSKHDGYEVSEEAAGILLHATHLWVQSLGADAKTRVGKVLLDAIQWREGKTGVGRPAEHPPDTALILARDKLNEAFALPQQQKWRAPTVEVRAGRLALDMPNEPLLSLVSTAVADMGDKNARFDICPYCKRPFRRERSNAKYCSTSCRVQVGKRRAEEKAR